MICEQGRTAPVQLSGDVFVRTRGMRASSRANTRAYRACGAELKRLGNLSLLVFVNARVVSCGPFPRP